jgi:hypothetical protein
MMQAWFANLRGRSLAARATLLGLAVFGLYALVAPVAVLCNGSAGLWAAATSAGLCFSGAALALMADRLFHGSNRALWSVSVGMLLRMGVPLAFALALQLTGGILAKAGLLYYLLVFYPVTLCLETALSLPLGDWDQRRTRVSRDAVS